MLQKADLSCEADSENYLGGSSETMYYIGLDVHKRTISYCVRHMTSIEIRDRRRTLRYRGMLVKQMVQMKNRISGLLVEKGVTHTKRRLHNVGPHYYLGLHA